MGEKQKNEDAMDEEAKWLDSHPEMKELSTLHDEMVEWMTQPINKYRPPRSDSG
jgi:hypothetical protein